LPINKQSLLLFILCVCVTQFENYSEPIPAAAKDFNSITSPTVTMLRDVAKEKGIYLIGGSVSGACACVAKETFRVTVCLFSGEGRQTGAAVVMRDYALQIFEVDTGPPSSTTTTTTTHVSLARAHVGMPSS
jgi:hypothetical protein